MSRIHEALEKAERNRNRLEPAATSGARDHEGEPLVSAAPAAAGTVGSEDIHCAVEEWVLSAREIVTTGNEKGSGAEQFRSLRSRLYELREKNPSLKTLLVSSALPAEGKSFVAANLAVAMAQRGNTRVLLVDGDLRRARLHTIFGTAAGPGLADVLSGVATVEQSIRKGRGSELYFLPSGSGTSHPAELIANGRLARTFEKFTHMFDWIILDSPPAALLSDASVLARVCDGVLLVAQVGTSKIDTVRKACRELQVRPILGVVLNRASMSIPYSKYGYYYGHGQEGSSGRPTAG